MTKNTQENIRCMATQIGRLEYEFDLIMIIDNQNSNNLLAVTSIINDMCDLFSSWLENTKKNIKT